MFTVFSSVHLSLQMHWLKVGKTKKKAQSNEYIAYYLFKCEAYCTANCVLPVSGRRVVQWILYYLKVGGILYSEHYITCKWQACCTANSVLPVSGRRIVQWIVPCLDLEVEDHRTHLHGKPNEVFTNNDYSDTSTTNVFLCSSKYHAKLKGKQEH